MVLPHLFVRNCFLRWFRTLGTYLYLHCWWAFYWAWFLLSSSSTLSCCGTTYRCNCGLKLARWLMLIYCEAHCSLRALPFPGLPPYPASSAPGPSTPTQRPATPPSLQSVGVPIDRLTIAREAGWWIRRVLAGELRGTTAILSCLRALPRHHWCLAQACASFPSFCSAAASRQGGV